MENITQWITNNQDLIIEYAIKGVVAIIILLAGLFVARLATGMLGKAMRKRDTDNAVISFLSAILKTVIVIAALLMALSHVGVQTTSFIAILGAAGLAIGLALQGSLSNIASGVLIILFRPFRAGEYVDAGGVSGSIEEINIFQTIMKTPDNKVVFVPNAQITGSPITNYNREELRRIDMVIGVSYSANLQKTKQVLMDVITADERVLKDPAPVVTVTNLNSSSVDFNVRPWVKGPDYWPCRWDLLEKIKDRLDQEGIGIPFPQMDVHVKKDT
ncbi:mechanosensitive ion channel protein [Idiomarina tyrosinivorans]|uniref:Small-conductance mechanosensitive channel n=1 Tax=Idiomarina tyrosinivorans TaxID=1445662 RepID=A0A432ZR33_9GAMM|nr:mechanosensitive ion channel domain-containing protein [Idiomarina tyrosinivorans]RUO80291.1 mechanosensitive ion channel protein [Idiomarina tyrosinivorans]